MSGFTRVRWQVSPPLCKRGAGGICFSFVAAENLKSPSVPLLQRGKNSEPNELPELKLSIFSTVWRKFQGIRYTLCRELPLRYFTMLKSFRPERAA